MWQTRPIPRCRARSPRAAKPRAIGVHAAPQQFGARVHEPRHFAGVNAPQPRQIGHDPFGPAARPAERLQRLLASLQVSDRLPASGACAVTAQEGVMGVDSGPEPRHAWRELPRQDLHVMEANMESASHASAWGIGHFPPCAVAASCGIGVRPPAASRASMPVPRTAHPAVQSVQRLHHESRRDGAAVSPREVLTCALNCCFSVFMPLTVRSRLQGSQPVENLLNACGVQRRSVRYRGCWTPPPAACQTPRRLSPKAPSMGADLDRTSACARTMLGIFEPECRVPGLRQSAAALLRQIAWAGLSGRVTAEALPRCFGGVRRRGGLRPLRFPGGPPSGGVRGRGARPRPSCRRVLMADRRTVTASAHVSPADLADWRA